MYVNCVSSDEYSLQSQSDAVKVESQTLPTVVTSESQAPVTSNPSEGLDLSVDEKTSSKVADDEEVLNLVKVKEHREPAETEVGSVAKEGDEKRHVKIAELLKSEAGDDVKKEHEKDDEDTLSESETAAGAKTVVDTVKDEAAVKLVQKDDADEEIDYSAVPSPCPEVCH